MRLKPSFYNHFAQIQSGKRILFNFLTGNWMEISEEQVAPLQFILADCNGTYTGEAGMLKQRLVENLYLIAEEANELDIIRINNLSSRYDNLFYNLVVMPTLDCNFDCSYCYESHKEVHMTDEVKEGVINWASRIARVGKRLLVNWFGGEPLLNFSLIEEVNRAIKTRCVENRCMFASDITTNAYLLTDEMLSKVDELNILSFQITIDGPPEIHNTYRPLKNGEGTFDVVFQNVLKILDQTRARVALRMNVDQNNFEHIPALLAMIPAAYRTPRLLLIFKDIFSDPGGTTGKEEGIHQKRIVTYQKMKQLYLQGMEMGFNVFLPTFTLQKHHCNSGIKNYFIVHPTGDLYRCTVEFETGQRVGKLASDGTITIDDYAAARWLSYIPGDDERCANCKFLPMCQGGCRYNRLMGQRPCTLESTDLDGVIELYYFSKLHGKNS